MKEGKNIFFGVVLVAIAVLWIVSKMGYIPGVEFGQIGFTILWSAWLIKGLFQKNAFPIFMSIAFLCIVWSKELNIESITPWPVIGSAILLSVGFSLIFGNSEKRKWEKEQHNNYHKENRDGYGHFESSHVDGENIKHVTKFSGAEKYIDSQNLKSVEIINKFGGSEIYMDKAIPSGNEVHVRIECLCGGVEVYIPRDWNIDNKIVATMGAVDIHGNYTDEAINDVKMILTGNVKFGGIEIIRV